MAEVLGRVTSRSLEIPRGPDVIHRIRVRQDWLERGALIELDVPRNLCCAGCEGGGCDRCERSGAVTLRGRKEPPEVIQVTLPRRSAEKLAQKGTVTIRIPEQGGLPRSSEEVVRGFLLLTVAIAADPDVGVRLLESPAPAPVSAPITVSAPRVPERLPEPGQPISGVRPVQPAWRRALIPGAVVLIVLWVAFLVYLRMTGRG